MLGVILFTLFYINNNTLPSIIITVLLSTSAVIILLILRDIDALMWKEDKWIWVPLEQAFKEMDLLPYFPDSVLFPGRVKLKKGEKVRVAYYPREYPDRSGKKVKVITVK